MCPMSWNVTCPHLQHCLHHLELWMQQLLLKSCLPCLLSLPADSLEVSVLGLIVPGIEMFPWLMA